MSSLGISSVALSPLLILITMTASSACNVGDVSTGTTSADAKPAGGADAQQRDPNCLDEATPMGRGKHNPGNSCMSGGCHDSGGGNTIYTVAGTLYQDKAGAVAVSGGTIVVVDANDVETKIVSARNGNFFSTTNFAFPIKVKASRCPNTNPMNGSVDATGGDCNAAGCHSGAEDRVFLP